jgi:hypothetical protein
MSVILFFFFILLVVLVMTAAFVYVMYKWKDHHHTTTVCLVAIFKNEGHIMKEWVTHYVNQGVDKLLLIDNGSDDSYITDLQPFIDNQTVELVVDPKQYSQVELYNKHFLDKCKRYDWVMVCDLDEFVYARKGCTTIKDFLNKVDPSVSQIFIPWKMFGSSGHTEQPQSVVGSFTKRTLYKNSASSLVKCIVRTRYLEKLDIHSHQTTNSNYITSVDPSSCSKSSSVHHPNKTHSTIDEQVLKDSCLHLNHYAIQSLHWFLHVKAKRGDATTNTNVRNTDYFHAYNEKSNEVEDSELHVLMTQQAS